MRKWLLGAALCVASVGALAAPGQARDLNGDGIVDAYYDAAYNQTWLAHLSGNGTFTDLSIATYQASLAYGNLGWRAPDSLSNPNQATECYGDQNGASCTFSGPSEYSRLDPLFPIADAIVWGGGLANMTFEGPDVYYHWPMFQQFGRTGYQAWAYPPPMADIQLLANGDFGVPITPVPEPGTYALMLAGLAALAWARRRHATSAMPRPART